DQIILNRICKNLSDLNNIQNTYNGQLQYTAFYGRDLNLKSIERLKNYTYLQKVDISFNQITDLTPLTNLHHLLQLNASTNSIDSLSGSLLPTTLKHADFTNNSIKDIQDFENHLKLTTLYADRNEISEIKGLSQCERLYYLSLSYNNISRIENLDYLPLQYLNLSNNRIEKIENLETLANLREINLSDNQISSLKGLKGHHYLEVINVNNNQINSTDEILHINSLLLLRIFTILGNPIENTPNFQKFVLYHIQRLLELNGSPVSVSDKVEAINMFCPSLDVVTCRNRMVHTLYSFLDNNQVRSTTISSTKHQYPIFGLVGPEGSGNKLLAMRLAEDFPQYFNFGIMETTRIVLPGEQENRDFNFISVQAFEKNVENGVYLVTDNYLNHYYGLRRSVIENNAEERKATITHMSLETMVCLQDGTPLPHFILTIQSTEGAHYNYMKALGIYSEYEIAKALHSRDCLIEYNQNNCGVFCHFVPTDCIETAHKKLKNILEKWMESEENVYNETRPIKTGNIEQQEENLFVALQRGAIEEESVRRRQLAGINIIKGIDPKVSESSERHFNKALYEKIKERRQTSDTCKLEIDDKINKAFKEARLMKHSASMVTNSSGTSKWEDNFTSNALQQTNLKSPKDVTDRNIPETRNYKRSKSANLIRLGADRCNIVPPIESTAF
ncbi:leucine-rich repeat and guanylate kinase domain-containing protein, partial [Argonauta hians]